MSYFLFSDDSTFHLEISASTWPSAIATVRAKFHLTGRLRIVEYFNGGEGKVYRLDKTSYTFSLKKVTT